MPPLDYKIDSDGRAYFLMPIPQTKTATREICGVIFIEQHTEAPNWPMYYRFDTYCSRCGVQPENLELHANWHILLDKLLPKQKLPEGLAKLMEQAGGTKTQDIEIIEDESEQENEAERNG